MKLEQDLVEGHDAQDIVETQRQILQEISNLTDLFRRRLLENTAANKLYDELSDQVKFANEGLARTWTRPLFIELVRIIDRLAGMPENAVAASVVDELVEILGRRGVRAIPIDGVFDPRIHEAVKVEPDALVPKGHIISTLRKGFQDDLFVIRASSVIVSSGPSEKTHEDLNNLVLTEQAHGEVQTEGSAQSLEASAESSNVVDSHDGVQPTDGVEAEVRGEAQVTPEQLEATTPGVVIEPSSSNVEPQMLLSTPPEVHAEELEHAPHEGESKVLFKRFFAFFYREK